MRRHAVPLSRVPAAMPLLLAVIVLSSVGRPSVEAWQNPSPANTPDRSADAKPAGSPILQRVLNNWKARQERTKSVHMTWDTKVPPPKIAPNEPAKNIGFRALHNELWLEGEKRSRVQQSFTRGPGYQYTRFGRAQAILAWQPDSLRLSGEIWSADEPELRSYQLALQIDPRVDAVSLAVPWLILRPLARPDGESGEFQLVSEDTLVENTHLVRIARTSARKKAVETYWVDPARQDILVAWKIDGPSEIPYSISFQYEGNPESEWVPVHWTVKIADGEWPWGVAVSTVTGFATTEEYPPDASHMTFPEGTVVLDSRSGEQYVAGKDGSKTQVVKVASPETLRVEQALNARVDFAIEPQAFLDAMDFIGQRYRIRVLVDKKAFAQARIDITTEVKVAAARLPLRQVLTLLFEQFPKPIGFQNRDGALVVAPVPQRRDSGPAQPATFNDGKPPAK
jgi:hypothetical protein